MLCSWGGSKVQVDVYHFGRSKLTMAAVMLNKRKFIIINFRHLTRIDNASILLILVFAIFSAYMKTYHNKIECVH